ncbi:hypothetical protein L6164_000693 [Bauhinia variegata]|uniref:Uncharacterized protein n=1 Tax=Bauhinia variegata TaxID=167791 RepID=A0ACB9QD71_BAUVA|nr:hypothetical protein L6164_000693 [Bauhinia variegata]
MMETPCLEDNDWVCHGHLIAPAFCPLNLKDTCMMRLKGEEKWQRIPWRDILVIMSDGPVINLRGKKFLQIYTRCRLCILRSLMTPCQPESQLKFINRGMATV